MPIYSQHSLNALASAHPLWTKILTYVLEELEIDHRVLEGHRGKDAQNAAFDTKKSTLRWPESKHNQLPSLAVDAVPCPIKWNSTDPRVIEKYKQEMVRFATVVQMVALFKFGVIVRWGGDWNRDWSLMDNVFNDYPHLELIL
jgi:peptidoglycan L-alanyl-D-glutamate endopeptidase CwlK